jgi:hypothetical protein
VSASVAVLPEARQDILDGSEFFEGCRAGLGAAFAAEVLAALDRIGAMPELYGEVAPAWERRESSASVTSSTTESGWEESKCWQSCTAAATRIRGKAAHPCELSLAASNSGNTPIEDLP